MKKILLLTDNEELLFRCKNIIKEKSLSREYDLHYAYSYNNKFLLQKFKEENWIQPINIKQEVHRLIEDFHLVISIHCKQIFPSSLIENVKCINIHPGLNPYNRGWFPQVFSIINGLPSGATIHEIDDKLDHGPVICQKEVSVERWDTSFSAYNKILNTEMELFSDNIEAIFNLDYTTEVKNEGNLNLKKDFNSLCQINLKDVDTFENHINRLRALSHEPYENAFFIDENNKKIFLKISLRKEEN